MESVKIKTSKQLWYYALFNLVLLLGLGAWFWQQNTAVALPEPKLPADGRLQCVSYSPYYGKNQTPLLINSYISKEQIDRDLALLAQRFHCVRIYSVAQGLDYVPEAAAKNGLKVLLGVWIGWTKADNERELNLAITVANRYPNVVKGLVVGNEVLLRGEQTEAALQGYLNDAKRLTNVPVTYADVWEFWLRHKDLEKSVDFITVHILPYWEDYPQSITNANSHTANVMDKLAENFKKPLLIGETGWPTLGRQRGESVPSQLNQARYLREFVTQAQSKGWSYNLIEAIDQPWKRSLEGAVGGYWGIYTSDLQAKFNFNGVVSERNDGQRPIYWAMAGMLFLLVLTTYIAKQSAGRLAFASLGTLAGVMSLLQINYLEATCRNLVEWLALGSMVAFGWLALVSIALVKTLQVNVSVQKNERLLPKLSWLTDIALLALMIGAAITGWLIMTDGRYRDFPLVIYALPALQLSVGSWILSVKRKISWQLFILPAASTLVTAVFCVWQDTYNLSAWLWVGLSILWVFASFLQARAPQITHVASRIS